MQSEKYIPEAAKNFKAPTTETASSPEGEFSPAIPRGWTILKHGTNLARWGESSPYNSNEITTERPLSVITQEEYDQNIREHGGRYNTTDGYASMTGPKSEGAVKPNKPFEMRILFYKNHERHRTDPEYAAKLTPEARERIALYYFKNHQGGRHPLVPKGEVLEKIGQTQEAGRDVFFFIPRSVAEAYHKESEAQ